MIIDLHIHSRTGSDGALSVEGIFREAKKRHIDFLSITDHDNIEPQEKAVKLAAANSMRYITGVELNVTARINDKSVSLDFLGYGYDYNNAALKEKLRTIADYREKRAKKIIENLNEEFLKEGRPYFTGEDLIKMQEGIDGVLGRPHIADYLIKKNVVSTRQEAFDKYLVKCDVPKYPLPPDEASTLIKNAGGKFVLAHPNDPNGTSLAHVTKYLEDQTKLIENNLLDYIDGIECWHSRADAETTSHYMWFCTEYRLIMTGGSDCHQKPVLMGTAGVPDWVAAQFRKYL